MTDKRMHEFLELLKCSVEWNPDLSTINFAGINTASNKKSGMDQKFIAFKEFGQILLYLLEKELERQGAKVDDNKKFCKKHNEHFYFTFIMDDEKPTWKSVYMCRKCYAMRHTYEQKESNG